MRRDLNRVFIRPFRALAFGALVWGFAQAQPGPTQPAVGQPAAKLPGIDTSKLDAEERAALVTLMTEGACPCDAKLTLLQCIEAKSCPKATELGNYGAARFRDGQGEEQVREAVVKKYLSDHVTYTFDLTGTPSKGAEKGRITIVEFADFECPHCSLVRPVLKEVLARFPKDVTLYFKPFPLGTHNFSEPAARAALAAHAQGRFWEMHDLLFDHQGRLDATKVKGFVAELGLNAERYLADERSASVAAMILRDRQEALQANLTGTPTIYINGKLYLDDKSVEALSAYIQQLLAAKK